jgi:hypothetical protein
MDVTEHQMRIALSEEISLSDKLGIPAFEYEAGAFEKVYRFVQRHPRLGTFPRLWELRGPTGPFHWNELMTELGDYGETVGVIVNP